MSDVRNDVRRRLSAVLDYDGVAEHNRAGYLTDKCGISKSTASRFLSGGCKSHHTSTYFKIYQGLDVTCGWFLDGDLRRYHPRTYRIHIQSVLHYPKDDCDRIMRMMAGCVAGHRKAGNLVDMVAGGKLSAVTAARLM